MAHRPRTTVMVVEKLPHPDGGMTFVKMIADDGRRWYDVMGTEHPMLYEIFEIAGLEQSPVEWFDSEATIDQFMERLPDECPDKARLERKAVLRAKARLQRRGLL